MVAIGIVLAGLLALPAAAQPVRATIKTRVPEISTDTARAMAVRLLEEATCEIPAPAPRPMPKSLAELSELAHGGALTDSMLRDYFDNQKADAPAAVDPNSHLVGSVHVLPRYLKRNAKGKIVIRVTREEQTKIAELAVAEADRQGLDPVFVLSFIGQESGFYRKAKGDAGEIGLMQLMPDTAMVMLKRENPKAKLTAKKVAKMLQDPETNIRLGVAVLKELQENLSDLARKKKVDMRKVLAAGFNAGQPSVEKTLIKHRRTPLSTKNYVKGILDKDAKLRKQVKKTSAAQAS